MLRSSFGAACPHLEVSVKQLLIEDSLFDQNEQRSFHREYLVRPVLIELRDTGETLDGFTRNISYLGVSIVTRKPFHTQAIAKIQVYRLNSLHTTFLAECRWTGPFGDEWNVAGWNFLNVDPDRLKLGS